MTRAEAFREGFVRARRSLVVTTWARLAAFLGAPAVRGPVPQRIVAAEFRDLRSHRRVRVEVELGWPGLRRSSGRQAGGLDV